MIESWYALFALNANKLIMIIVSLASAMAVTAIPLLSAAHTQRDYRSIAKQISNILDLFLFVMIPASFGMAAIATPIYTIFYSYDPLGSSVLYLSSFTAISLGLFTVLMAILQGLSENGLAIKYLMLGLIIKAILQYPMILMFKVYGPLVSTNLGMLAIILLALKHLEISYDYFFNWDVLSCFWGRKYPGAIPESGTSFPCFCNCADRGICWGSLLWLCECKDSFSTENFGKQSN